jgi:hypothetical protein
MNIVTICPRFTHRLVWLLLAVALVHPAHGARLVEETFPVLKTRTGTYTNVTVTTRADSYVFILHSTGMTSIKIPDLPVEVRRQLGYPTPDAPAPVKSEATVSVAAKENETPTATSQEEAVKQWKAHFLQQLAASKINSEVLLTVFVVGLLFHLFFSYCCSQICSKAGSPGGLLVWLPILQIFPLLRAADMSGWWFLGYFVPVLNLVTHILWALNITKARGKDIWVAILLILPITNLFAFLYLAFSSSAPSEDSPPSKFQSRRLQTA